MALELKMYMFDDNNNRVEVDRREVTDVMVKYYGPNSRVIRDFEKFFENVKEGVLTDKSVLQSEWERLTKECDLFLDVQHS